MQEKKNKSDNRERKDERWRRMTIQISDDFLVNYFSHGCGYKDQLRSISMKQLRFHQIHSLFCLGDFTGFLWLSYDLVMTKTFPRSLSHEKNVPIWTNRIIFWKLIGKKSLCITNNIDRQRQTKIFKLIGQIIELILAFNQIYYLSSACLYLHKNCKHSLCFTNCIQKY